MNNIIQNACPIVPSPESGTVGQLSNHGTSNRTVSLKALADKVLERDKRGTKNGTPYLVDEDLEERLAIQQFDGGNGV